jgi:probable F420-dependent oxidoreductase
MPTRVSGTAARGKSVETCYNQAEEFDEIPADFSKNLFLTHLEQIMQLGWALPNLGTMTTRSALLTIAREAERRGYATLWAAERLLYPTHPRQSGPSWPPNYKRTLNNLETLTFIAAATERIRLGTSTLDFPYYQPAQLAKAIATLDVLSEGRAIICAGLGWSEDEYEASGVPFSQRSGRLNEIIEALNVLWGPDPVEFHGRYYDVPQTLFNPKPIQQPRPPLLLAGSAPAALSRAARLSDGFNPLAAFTKAENEQMMQSLWQAWHDAGREPAQPAIVVRVNHGRITDEALGADRKFLTGSSEQVGADLVQLAAWGATEVFFSVRSGLEDPAEDLQVCLDQMNRFSVFIGPTVESSSGA